MPKFFLDLSDGASKRDGESAAFETAIDARAWADERLFTLAMEDVTHGREPALVLLMRDEDDRPIYRASLAMQGTWLMSVDG